MRKALKAIGAVAALLLVSFIAYESFAVWQAKQRTPRVLAFASKGELKLSDVEPRRIAMLLEVEDPNFYGHKGVDFSTPGAGMTSITQGLVKRFYFDRFRPGFAKIEQSLIARFVLDPAMSKDRQLQAYLNFTYFGSMKGRAVIGYADAARTYHGEELSRLRDREFLSLVAMTMAPNRLDPIRHKAANAERVRRIESMLAGKCKPTGLRDVAYEACAKLA
ncbi:MAG TPA: transglycosylase domain-containing protein [Sphingomicrobium sp.]|nr:transglycosylase domain-containing protein [Sphingomicrobium sp.]